MLRDTPPQFLVYSILLNKTWFSSDNQFTFCAVLCWTYSFVGPSREKATINSESAPVSTKLLSSSSSYMKSWKKQDMNQQNFEEDRKYIQVQHVTPAKKKSSTCKIRVYVCNSNAEKLLADKDLWKRKNNHMIAWCFLCNKQDRKISAQQL